MPTLRSLVGAFALCGLVATAAAAEERVFNAPTVNGRPVERCYSGPHDCKLEAANQFCKMQEPPFARASSAAHEAAPPGTWMLGNRAECTRDCTRYTQIVCTTDDVDHGDHEFH